MPELPEVETIVRQLDKKIRGKVISSFWQDWPFLLRYPSWLQFKKIILKQKIKEVKRRGKFILFYLSSNFVLILHLKISGHLLFYSSLNKSNPTLKDKYNQHIHFILRFKDGTQLALSDLRKFARLVLLKEDKLSQYFKEINLGPEPLSPKFTFEEFQKRLIKRKGRIKPLLLNQTFVAGIGNIYADEILFKAKIHPLSLVSALKRRRHLSLFRAIKDILKKAILSKGTSIIDYRDSEGKKGRFQNKLKVYHRHNLPCIRCKNLIKRIKIGSRSSHFCPKCQKLYV